MRIFNFKFLIFKLFLLIFLFFLVFPTVVSAQVVINEFLPNPSSGEDWLELYSPVDVDISGWILDDEATSDMATIPQGTIVGPSSNVYYTVDVGNRLNQSEDTVSLYTPSKSSLIDSYNYKSNPGTDVSYGRTPDGESWGHCQPTKGNSNTGCYIPTPTPQPTSTPTSAPSPTKTPTPVPTKTGTPTPKVTPKVTSKPSVSPSPMSSPESTGLVLGESQAISLGQSSSPSPTPESGEKKNFPIAGMFLIGGGLICIAGAGFTFYRNLKKGLRPRPPVRRTLWFGEGPSGPEGRQNEEVI